MTREPDDDLQGLEALADVPAPRRSDDAFARAVAADVAARRQPRWLWLPAAAAAGAAVFVVVGLEGGPAVVNGPDAGVRTAVLAPVDDAVDDAADDDVVDPLFGQPLDDEALIALDASLSRALSR